jgi:hypothetical protein
MLEKASRRGKRWRSPQSLTSAAATNIANVGHAMFNLVLDFVKDATLYIFYDV